MAPRVTGDQSAFYGCGMYGAHQDTLFDEFGRHYFIECFIQRSIDIIFGGARSLDGVTLLYFPFKKIIYHYNHGGYNHIY